MATPIGKVTDEETPSTDGGEETSALDEVVGSANDQSAEYTQDSVRDYLRGIGQYRY